MEFLRELHLSMVTKEQNLQLDFENLKHQYYNILDNMERMLSESTDLGFSRKNTTLSDLENNVEKLGQMLVAAGRGLGVANKLKGAEGAKHRSVILSNLNRIRARLNTLAKELEYYMNQTEVPFTPASPAPGVAPDRRVA